MDIRNDIKLLASKGISMLDIFSRFGSILYKANIMKANEFLDELSRKNKDR